MYIRRKADYFIQSQALNMYIIYILFVNQISTHVYRLRSLGLRDESKISHLGETKDTEHTYSSLTCHNYAVCHSVVNLIVLFENDV